jgi:hypothetical protein
MEASMERSTPEQTQNPISRFVQYYETLKSERPNDFSALKERRRVMSKVWYEARKNDTAFKEKEAARKRLFRASKATLKKS